MQERIKHRHLRNAFSAPVNVFSTHVGAGTSFRVQSPEGSGRLEGASRMRCGTLDTIHGDTPVAGIHAPVFSVAILDVV